MGPAGILGIAQLAHAGGTAIDLAGSAAAGFASMLQNAVNAGSGAEQSSPADNTASPLSQLSTQRSLQTAGALDIEALREQTTALSNSLHQQIVEVLEANGIDVGAGVHLQLDGSGQIQVAGREADAEAIQQALATRPEIAGALPMLAANTQLLAAIDRVDAARAASTTAAGQMFPPTGLTGATSAGTFDLFITAQQAVPSLV